MKIEMNVWQNLRADQWTRDAVEVYDSPVWEFSQSLPRFSPGYKGTDNMFYLFYKIIIFCLNKKKDDIQSVYLYFNFFHSWNCKFLQIESQSYRSCHFCASIALWKHTCSPIKTHVLSKLFYRLFYKITCNQWYKLKEHL